MNIASLIGTGAAWLNYRKAKANYDRLKEQKEGIQAAVDLYQSINYYNKHKFDKQESDVVVKENNIPDGVYFSSVLRVSYMIGQFCLAKPSLVVSNTSENNYTFENIKIQCSIKGTPVNILYNTLGDQSTEPKPGAREKNFVLVVKPGETKEFEFESGRTMLMVGGKSVMGEIRDLICKTAGKKLITSCPKTNVDGIATTFSRFTWDGGKEGWLYEIPCVLRYCGELPL